MTELPPWVLLDSRPLPPPNVAPLPLCQAAESCVLVFSSCPHFFGPWLGASEGLSCEFEFGQEPARPPVTCWGCLGHREPDVQTTGPPSREAGHSMPAWVPALPLLPLRSLRDVPSGLASGPRLQGNKLFAGCG